MAIANGENCYHRNRQKDPGDTGDFRAGQNRENHRERVQMNALANDTRIDHIVLNNAQHGQEEQHHHRHAKSPMQHREHRNQNRNHQRPNQRHELQHAGEQAEHQRTGQTNQGKADAAKNSDEQTRGELRANISCQSAVDVLEEFVAAPTQTTARQHCQSGTAKAIGVFQQKETEDGDQHDPRQKDDPAEHVLECRCRHFAAPGDQAEHGVIQCRRNAFRHSMLFRVLTDSFAVAGDCFVVRNSLLLELRELRGQLRECSARAADVPPLRGDWAGVHSSAECRPQHQGALTRRADRRRHKAHILRRRARDRARVGLVTSPASTRFPMSTRQVCGDS